MPNRNRHPGRSIRIEDELWEAAMAAAQQNREPLSAVVRDALRRYVKNTAKAQGQRRRGGPPRAQP